MKMFFCLNDIIYSKKLLCDIWAIYYIVKYFIVLICFMWYTMILSLSNTWCQSLPLLPTSVVYYVFNYNPFVLVQAHAIVHSVKCEVYEK